MPGEDIQSWSKTALDNGNSDTLINWLEGQARATVNNSARSMMAALAKARDLQDGSIVTAGTANAQTFISGVGYTSVPTGLRVLLKIGPALTNTGATTLNMDSIGAVAVKTQAAIDFVGNELIAGSLREFCYDGTNWILLQDARITTVIQSTTVTIALPVPAVTFITNIDATYEQYLFTLTDIVPVTDATEFWVRVSEDLGATWKTGAQYRWASHFLLDTPALNAAFGSDSATKIQLTNASMSNLPAGGLGGTLRMFNPASTTSYKKFMVDAVFRGAGAGVGRWIGGGMYVGSTNPINGVQFTMSGGDIASGTIRMYGVTGG